MMNTPDFILHRLTSGLLILVVSLLFVVLPGARSYGQQEVTDTPSEPPTAISPPSETPLSPAPAASPTENPTVTPFPTTTETPLPTVTATPVPTETPIPGATVSFTEMATFPPTLAGPATLLVETAEADSGLWSFAGGWARTNTGSVHSGAWAFTASPSAPYRAGAETILGLAQPLSLPAGAQVRLQYWQWLELGAGDVVGVEVSTDGVAWVTVFAETGRNRVWAARTVNLDAYTGHPLWLRFVLRADADPATVGEGWRLDDIVVRAQPLPVTPRSGLSVAESDDPALWLAEGGWRATGGLGHDGGLVWTAAPQPETAVALTLNADVSLAGMDWPALGFWHRLDLAAGDDRAEVQVSTDGGQTWLPLGMYTAGNNVMGWTPQVLDLSGYAGQAVRVRFLLVTGSDGAEGTGWMVDAIALQPAVDFPPTGAPTPLETVLSETPAALTATPETGTSPTLAETASWTTYADTDPLLAYGGGTWQTFAVRAAEGGTLTASADPGATLRVHFEGTGIRVLYARGPEGRAFSAQVDGGSAQVADGFANRYSYGYVLAFENLSGGVHTLVVTNGDGAIWVEAVQARGRLLAGAAITPTPAFFASPTPPGPPTKRPRPQAVLPAASEGAHFDIADGDVEGLISAINAGNQAGGATIDLAAGGLYVLTAADNFNYGDNGLPVITSAIAINGNGATIRRHENAAHFRIFMVDGGLLTLNDLTIRDGFANATGGGGVLNTFGDVELTNSFILDNTVESLPMQILGGGIYVYEGNLTVLNSTISGNQNLSADGDGGGVGIISGDLIISGSAIYNNQTERDGGGVASLFQISAQVSDSCLTGNNRIGEFAGPYQTMDARDNWWGSVEGPITGGAFGDGVRDAVNDRVNYSPYRNSPPPCGASSTAPLYAIALIDDGTRPWSGFETQSINDGIAQVGQAFDYLATTVDTPEDAFNLVMLESSGTEILFIRTQQSEEYPATVTIENYQYQYGSRTGQTATFHYPDIWEGYCITYQEGMIGNVLRPAAVICNGDLIDQYSGTTQTLEASQYTIVHELGHLFDYRTGDGISDPISGGNYALRDCNLGVVMGLFQDDWTRGRRGWGTGPAQYYNQQGIAAPLVTDFQQNTDNTPAEAAADSFLNWVYRLNASGGAQAVDTCALTPLPPYDHWTGPGFLNQEWSATPHPSFIPDSAGVPGTPDPSLPGDSRHFDLDARMWQIFVSSEW